MKSVALALMLVFVAGLGRAATSVESRAAAPAGDGQYTDVRIEGDVVTIVVPLAVVLGWDSDGPPPAEVVAFLQEGFAAGEAYWNAGFARLAACFELRLQVDVAVTTIEGQSTPEIDRYHIVYPYSQFRAGTFPDGRGLPTVTSPGLRTGDLAGDADTTYPFSEFTAGYLPEWLFEDPWAMAHEFGHFFGLGDDYRDGAIIPGREGTLMGGTEGGDYIDQAVIDDVAKLIEEAGYDLPHCITGRFLLDYDQHFVTEFQDHDTDFEVEVTFSLKPRDDGSLEGIGVLEFFTFTHDVQKSDIPGNGCETFLGPIRESWPVKLTGRFTGDVLSFEVDPPTNTLTVTSTGSCGTDTYPFFVGSFPGWADIRFTDGVYEYVTDTPHTAPNVGNSHLELKMKQKPPD